MLKPLRPVGEIISLGVMLLLVAALVASQADASNTEQARQGPAYEQTQAPDAANSPLRTTIRAHLIDQALTISIDPVSGFGNFRLILK